MGTWTAEGSEYSVNTGICRVFTMPAVYIGVYPPRYAHAGCSGRYTPTCLPLRLPPPPESPASPHPASAAVTDDLLLRYALYLGQGTCEVSDSPLWCLRLIEGSGDSPMCLIKTLVQSLEFKVAHPQRDRDTPGIYPVST